MDAIRGYEAADSEVEAVVRDVLFQQAYEVLAAGEARAELLRDPGVQQVREALAAEGIDPAAMTRSEFFSTPNIGLIKLDTTGEGVLASQVAAIVRQVSSAVHGHAELLPLPEAEMQDWRDDLDQRTRDVAAQALVDDPTYRAGIAVAVPDWDGSLEGLRSSGTEAGEDFADAVLTISGGILVAVQNTLVAVCTND